SNSGQAGSFCAAVAISLTPAGVLNDFVFWPTLTSPAVAISSGKRQGCCGGNRCLVGKPQFLRTTTGSAGVQKRGAASYLSSSSSFGGWFCNLCFGSFFVNSSCSVR